MTAIDLAFLPPHGHRVDLTEHLTDAAPRPGHGNTIGRT